MNFFSRCYKVVKGTLVVATFGLAMFVLGNAAVLEMNYMSKYENSYQTALREHERQLIVGAVISSQHQWEGAGAALRTAYFEERANRIQLEKQAYLMEHEIYMFLRILDQDFPGVRDQVLDKMGELPPNVDIEIPLDEPTPADLEA